MATDPPKPDQEPVLHTMEHSVGLSPSSARKSMPKVKRTLQSKQLLSASSQQPDIDRSAKAQNNSPAAC